MSVKLHTFDFDQEIAYTLPGCRLGSEVEYGCCDVEDNYCQYHFTNLKDKDKPLVDQNLENFSLETFTELFEGKVQRIDQSTVLRSIERFMAVDVTQYIIKEATDMTSTKYTKCNFSFEKMVELIIGSLKNGKNANLGLSPDDVVVFSFTFKSKNLKVDVKRKIAFYCKVRGGVWMQPVQPVVVSSGGAHDHH